MTVRALKIRPGLDAVAALDRDMRKNELCDEDWKVVAEVHDFLEPFAEVTKIIEGSNYPTLALVLPLFNTLIDFAEDWAADTSHSKETVEGANAARVKLLDYYVKTSEVHVVAIVLDPRLKMDHFIDNSWDTDVKPT